ncbi:MAG: hypothetical protein CM1200mP41_39450 [Gammaproteobacteria bacterium]|nr:MAG: hypothetical protein CM1200mP41_39450 [Gammaproteobacteria bacterium]
MWRGGCIIRAQFLSRIKQAFDADPGLANLLLAPYFQQAIASSQGHGAALLLMRCRLEFRCQLSPVRSLTTMVTAVLSYRLIFYRHSVIILVPTPTSESIARAGSFFIPTGPAAAVQRLRHRTTPDHRSAF